MKAALDLVHDGAPPTEEPEQLDLIGADAPDSFLRKNEEKRGPGRPPGARNKRTQEWAEFLLSRYASPLEVLAQIANARVDQLSRDIGCTRLEALQEKRFAAVALLPYVHQKQAVAVDLNNTSIVHLTIVDDREPEDAGAITLTATVVDRIDGEHQS